MEETRIKHLEFVENIIARMNSNSFAIKKWMITIVSAFLAIYANNKEVSYIFAAIAPTFIFWFLDAYYLRLERRFRDLYQDIVYDRAIPEFIMTPKDITDSYIKVLFSPTLILLYIPIIISLVITGLILNGTINWG